MLAPFAAPSVSIVIRNWNAIQYLELTLETLLRNTQGVDYEVIIVDDNSDRSSFERLLNLNATRVVLNSHRVGVAGVTWQGAQLARGRYVVLLDNDVLVPENWLTDLLAELSEHQAKLIYPRRQRGLVQPETKEDIEQAWNRVKSRRSVHLDPYASFLEFSGGRDITEFAQAVMQSSAVQTEFLTSPPDFLGGSCLLYEREFIDRVGGVVNKPFFPYGGEDVDLAWRVGYAGGAVIISGRVHVHHFEHSSIELNELDVQSFLSKNSDLLFSAWADVLEEFLVPHKTNKDDLENIAQRYRLIKAYLSWRSARC